MIAKTVPSQKNAQCAVRDVSGGEVLVPPSALCGPQVFFIFECSDGFYFWTLADAQQLLKLIVQRNNRSEMQAQLDVLCAYVHDRHQQPANKIKHAAVIELFTAFSIKPRSLANKKLAHWGVALTLPVRDVLEDSLSLLAATEDLAIIDAKTGGITPLPMVAEDKKRMLSDRAAGVAPFPFLYQKEPLETVDYTKVPTKSLSGTSWRKRTISQALLALMVLGGAGIAFTKWNTPVYVPPPKAPEPTPQPPQGVHSFAPTYTTFRRYCASPSRISRMKAQLRKNAVMDETLSDDEDRNIFPGSQEAWDLEERAKKAQKDSYVRLLQRGVLHPKTVAGHIGAEAVAHVIGRERTREVFGQEIADACFAGNAMDDDTDDGLGVEPASVLPLFFLALRDRVVAVCDERYLHVREQCSSTERELLDTVVTVHGSIKNELVCESTLVRDERVVGLFENYAPELFA